METLKLTEASRGLSMIRGGSCGWRGVAAAVVRRVLYFDRVYLRLHVAEVMQYGRWNQTHTLWFNIYIYIHTYIYILRLRTILLQTHLRYLPSRSFVLILNGLILILIYCLNPPSVILSHSLSLYPPPCLSLSFNHSLFLSFSLSSSLSLFIRLSKRHSQAP